MRLTIELVPRSCFYKNVRSNVTREEWDAIRFMVYENAGFKCEICGKESGMDACRVKDLEAHEVFEYKDGIQKLVRLEALCSACHGVKHIGRLQMISQWRYKKAIEHFAKINRLTHNEIVVCLHEAQETWLKRSNIEWELDISYLNKFKIQYEKELFDQGQIIPEAEIE